MLIFGNLHHGKPELMLDTQDSPVAPSLPARLGILWANPQVRYPLLVLVYLLVIGSAFNAVLQDLRGPLEQLEELTAASVHHFVRIFTQLTTQRGNLVTLDGFAVSIIIECVGLLEMLIYSACVLAFPAPIRTRALGVFLGCLAIFLFNILRIATLLLVGRHWSDYFDFFHVYFWQATLIAMIVSVLYGWIKLFVHR
jgi:archaeosortase B (VPXXXP-CTERM-specific)